MTTEALAWVRVSTGSQDESTQIRDLTQFAADHDIHIVETTRLHGYSASRGEQEPALREAIDAIGMRRYRLVLVTDSSRLDRDEDLDAQAAKLLAIRQAGGDVISITEPQFGKTDFAGRIVTLVAQYGNAQKSRVVKDSTWRGVQGIIANGALHAGCLPLFWRAVGERYAKVATCTDPQAVKAVYIAVRDGRSLSSIARQYGTYPKSIQKLIRLRANFTGVFECRYTHAKQLHKWQHTAAGEPPVDLELWHAANQVMDERGAALNNTGGRPVHLARSWISGLLPCPRCGGHLYVLRGKTLRCAGKGKNRRSCGVAGISLASIIAQLEYLIVDATPADVYRYLRVSGNQGELNELTAELDQVRHALAATEDDDEFEALSARRRELRKEIADFQLVPDSYEMTPTGETLASLWRHGDRRATLKAIMQHIAIQVAYSPEGVPVYGTRPVRELVVAEGSLPVDTLIELTDGVCIKAGPSAPARWVLLG